MENSTPFDPAAFLNTTFTDANATRVIPCPAGEYVAQVKDVKSRVAKESIILDVLWTIDDAVAKDRTGKKEVVVRQSLFLDFENGMLSFSEGKNVALGKVRKAVNQNIAGQPWSPMMLKGGTARVRVENKPSEKDPEDVFDNVVAVSPL
jgi:hypothetical protein